MTKGEVTKVHHFDSKAEVESYIRTIPFPSKVFFLPGWFMQNVWHPFAPMANIVCHLILLELDHYTITRTLTNLNIES
jgi:hypothetical protein